MIARAHGDDDAVAAPAARAFNEVVDPAKHSLQERFSAGDGDRVAIARIQFFRLTGGGAAFFLDFSASFSASRVPSMASSRLSL